MCLQDLAIGQSTTSAESSVLVGLTDTLLAAADPTRTVLVFGQPLANSVWVTSRSAAAVGTGFILTPSTPPLVLCLADWGTTVQRQWRGIAVTAAQSISVVAGLLSVEQFRQRWREMQERY